MDTPEDESLAKPKKASRRRYLDRALALVLLLAGIVAALYSFENWRGNRAWIMYRQAAEARGEPMEVTALAIKHRQGDQESEASFAEQVAGFHRSPEQTDGLGYLDNSIPPDRQFQDLAAWGQAFTALKAGQSSRDLTVEQGDTNASARLKGAEVLLESLEAQAPLMEKLRTLCQAGQPYPFGYDRQDPDIRFRPAPRIFDAIKVCSHLRLKTSAELAAGKNAHALRDFELMLSLSDSLRREPGMISAIGRVACRTIALRFPWEGLAMRRFTEPELRYLEQLLGSEDLVGDVRRVFLGERANTLPLFDWLQKTRRWDYFTWGSGAGFSREKAYDLTFHLMPGSWIALDKLNYCTWMDQIMAAGFADSSRRVRPGTLEQAWATIYRRLAEPQRFGHLLDHTVISAFCMPKVLELVANSAAAQVTTDQTKLACALERYHLKHDRYPEDLANLLPDFVQSIPADPLSGEFYRYQREENGRYKLWSVGWNEKDDHGVPGAELFDRKAGDWVWRYP